MTERKVLLYVIITTRNTIRKNDPKSEIENH